MTSKHKRLAYTAGGFAFVLVVGWNLISSSPGVVSYAPPTSATLASSPSPSLTPTPVAVLRSGATSAAGEVDYAIAAAELSGLSPDTPPGTLLDLWVAWDPPITDEPQVQRLLRGVRLSRLVPPATPEGPEVALLSIRPSQVSDLIWGDRYGSLSVTTITSRP